MSNRYSLSQLTRSLMVGASAGSIAFIQVGCVPAEQTSRTETAGSETSITVGSEAERTVCQQALRSKSAADVNRLMSGYPNSTCIAPLLNALPAPTLAALSPDALNGLGGDVVGRLSPRVKSQLPVQLDGQSAQAVPFPGASDDDGGSRY